LAGEGRLLAAETTDAIAAVQLLTVFAAHSSGETAGLEHDNTKVGGKTTQPDFSDISGPWSQQFFIINSIASPVL
jgi:hypothetical protein